MSRDCIVIDAETAKIPDEVEGGWDATDKLGISCVCIWEYKTERMRIYGPNDLKEVQERILKADKVTGFNIWNFDFPLIWCINRKKWIEGSSTEPITEDSYYTIDWLKWRLKPKTNDILRRIWRALVLDPDNYNYETHGGWSLNNIVKATLLVQKIGHGAEAPKWYQSGDIWKVINYCADDVALERDLNDFINRNGYVLNDEKEPKKLILTC